MTGLEKIIEDIRTESGAAVDAVLEKARTQAAAVMEEAGAEAEAQCGKIRKDSESRIAEIEERTRSAAELLRRRALLSAKQALIAEVIEAAKQKLDGLPAEQYFAVLTKMAVAAAHPGETGRICFSETDRKRLPADFSERLNRLLPDGTVLKLSEKAADIRDGFLLDYDGIEENGSFDAIFAEKRELLQDSVQAILFGSEN